MEKKLLKLNNINKTTFIYVFFAIFFLLITNEISLIYNYNNAAASAEYYLKISGAFPKTAEFLNNVQSYLHSERFLISYFVGGFSKLFGTDIYKMFIILTSLSLLILIYTYLLNLKNFDLTILERITFLNLLIFNPYIFRYFIANPVMLNDLIFVLSINLLILSVLKEQNIFFYTSLILALISRQNYFILLISFFLVFLYKKNSFFNYKKLSFITIAFFLNFILSKTYLNIAGLDKFYLISITGLKEYLLNTPNFTDLIIFICLPFFSIGPIILIIIFSLLKKNIKFEFNQTNLFIILTVMGLLAQPLLAGPEVAGRNIIRLTCYSFLPLIFLFLKLQKKQIFSFSALIIINILIIFWSFHPSFSKIKIFNELKLTKDFIIN
tara:strand:- start:441 stop:1586 length:1146 start_codon:yes stop_codon:yes gene_type:complete